MGYTTVVAIRGYFDRVIMIFCIYSKGHDVKQG